MRVSSHPWESGLWADSSGMSLVQVTHWPSGPGMKSLLVKVSELQYPLELSVACDWFRAGILSSDWPLSEGPGLHQAHSHQWRGIFITSDEFWKQNLNKDCQRFLITHGVSIVVNELEKLSIFKSIEDFYFPITIEKQWVWVWHSLVNHYVGRLGGCPCCPKVSLPMIGQYRSGDLNAGLWLVTDPYLRTIFRMECVWPLFQIFKCLF